MGNYNNSNRRNFSQNRGTDRPTMHSAVCDDCGRNCKVPFKPTGNKPIYCSSCFDNQNGGRSDRGNDRGGRNNDRGGNRNYGRDNNRGGDRNFNRRDSREDRQMFDAVCDKCHESCQVPFRPTQGKPLFCEKCFDKPGNTNLNKGADTGALQKQIDDMNKKLDKIVASLDILAQGRIVKEVKIVSKKSKEDKEGPILKSAAKKTATKKPVTKKVVAKKKSTVKKAVKKKATTKK